MHHALSAPQVFWQKCKMLLGIPTERGPEDRHRVTPLCRRLAALESAGTPSASQPPRSMQMGLCVLPNESVKGEGPRGSKEEVKWGHPTVNLPCPHPEGRQQAASRKVCTLWGGQPGALGKPPLWKYQISIYFLFPFK